MPNENITQQSVARHRRSAYSVVEVARLCRLSRARFYGLIDEGVIPPPVYDLRTRRPFYTAELAARCLEVRETNVGIDGRYVLFHERRRAQPPVASVAAPPSPRRSVRPDPLTQEMVESLRSMGITSPHDEIVEAIRQRCPQGVVESTFEVDLLAIYSVLRASR